MEVCAQLRRVARSVDALMRETLTANAGSLSMRLGEASHAVHRALIALQEDVATVDVWQRRPGYSR
jgi:hypothetical protein